MFFPEYYLVLVNLQLQEIPIACIGTHAVAIIPAAVPAAMEQLPPSLPKRRGRRPKRCRCCSPCNDSRMELNSTPQLPEPGPRDAEPPRGLPIVEQLPPPSMPKRRGRPPKTSVCNDNGYTGPKQAPAPLTTEVSSVCGDGSSAVRKRCGRLPKRRMINDTDRNGRQGQAPATADVDASVVVPIGEAPAFREAQSGKRSEYVLALPRQQPLWTATGAGMRQGTAAEHPGGTLKKKRLKRLPKKTPSATCWG